MNADPSARPLPAGLDEADYRRRVLACWLGKSVGGTLGEPYEGVEHVLELTGYDPVPTGMQPNDDLDLQVVWACVLSEMDAPRVDSRVLADAWQRHVGFHFDEYGIAKRNLALGLLPPTSGSYDNPYTAGMGAAIRSELWACLAPGEPALAAAFAREDACVDHAGEGLWAAQALAAMEAAAFFETDRHALLETGLDYFPADSRTRAAIEDARDAHRRGVGWRTARDRLVERHAAGNFTDVAVNLGIIALGLLYGEGDFSRSILAAVNAGFDADCTCATLGALLAIQSPHAIDSGWLEPIGTELVLSPEITGFTPPPTLEGFTELVADLRGRIGAEPPLPQEEQPTGPLAVRCEVGFLDSHLIRTLPREGDAAWAMPENARTLDLPGTFVRLGPGQIHGPTVLVRYRLHLDRDRRVRVYLTSRQLNCAWLDGEFAWRREASERFTPGPHRMPVNQSKVCELSAGEHELLAALDAPDPGLDLVWAAGISDDADGSWRVGAFDRPGREEGR